MTAYLYLSKNRCLTSHQSFDLETEQGLPSIAGLMSELNTRSLDGKLTVLLQDDLLHPLRITLDQKPARKELAQFLGWKTRKFLPWPVDEVSMRYLPLSDDNTWLTFSLLNSWTTALFDALKARDIHCGYIGGLCMTLLENVSAFRGSATLAFFDDFYLYCSLDQKGNYTHFAIRRLPFDASGNLDTHTLIHSDLKTLGQGLSIFNFEPDLDNQMGAIRQAIGGDMGSNTSNGNTLERFLAVLHDLGGRA